MQVENQTLTEIVRNAIQMSAKPDYVGWSIGILGVLTGLIAIVITIMIYRKQVKLTRQFDKIRKEAISNSLRRLRTIIHDGQQSVHLVLKMVDTIQDTDEVKFGIVENLMKIEHESGRSWTYEMMKEADFVRMSITPELYNQIVELSQHIKSFHDEELLKADYGSTLENLKAWRNDGQMVIDWSEKVISHISELDAE